MPIIFTSVTRIFALLCMAVLICGCGQIGPLYLPDAKETPDTTQTDAPDVTDATDEQLR